MVGVLAGDAPWDPRTRAALAEAVYREELADLCGRARTLQATLPAGEALAAFLRGMVARLDSHQGLARTGPPVAVRP